MIVPEKPSLDELSHHGVKGMHWGIRKQYDPHPKEPGSAPAPTGSKSSAPATTGSKSSASAVGNKISASVRARAEKVSAPIAPSISNNERRHLTDKQKKELEIAGAVALAAGLTYLGVRNKAALQGLAGSKKLNNLVEDAPLLLRPPPPSIKPIDITKFEPPVDWSKMHQQLSDFSFNKNSFERKEFSLPVGHTFHRISSYPEKSFYDATYCSPDTNDFNRYAASFGSAMGGTNYHIQFHATEEIKVPSMHTVLDTLHSVMKQENPNVKPEDVLRAYHHSVNGSKFEDVRSFSLIHNLKKQGYGAMIDVNNEGIFADKPLVLFTDKVTSKTTTTLTAKEIQLAKSLKTEVLKPYTPFPGLPAAHSTTNDIVGRRFMINEEDEFLHAMAVGEEFLEHHGVKGMKWGVRKAGANVASAGRSVGGAAKTTGRVAAKVGKGTVKTAKLAAFHLNANSERTIHKIVNDAHKNYKATDLKAINAKPEYVKASKLGNRLKHPMDPTTKAYRNEAKTAYIKQLEKSANSIHGVNGQYRYTIKDVNYVTGKSTLPTSKYAWSVSVQRRPGVHHAASDNVDLSSTFNVDVQMDADGFITGLGNPVIDKAMAQSSEDFNAHLAHDSSPMTAEADKLKVSKSDHVVTQKVKQDHNTLSDAAFQAKYKVSKNAYRGRVAKTKGDPFAAAKKN